MKQHSTRIVSRSIPLLLTAFLISNGALLPKSVHGAVALDEAGTVKLFGDFRFRAERDDSEKADGTDRDRERLRLRARLGVKYQPADQWLAQIRMATNTSGLNSPHSTFETANTAKNTDFGLDQAFMAYMPNKSFTFVAGKTPINLFQGSEQVWDNDINPEALAMVYKGGPLTFNAAYAVVDDKSWNNDDDWFHGQLVYGADTGFGKLKLGAAFINLNSHNAYQAKQHTFLVGQLKTGGWRFVAEAISSDADEQDTGYILQLRKKLNDKNGVRFYYHNVEAFSVPGDGTLTQDDFPNPGSTGVSNFEGYRLQWDHKFAKKVAMDVRYYYMERIEDKATLATTASDAVFNEDNRSRIQLNLNLKF